MVFWKDGTLFVAGGRPGQEGDVRVYNIDAKTGKVEDGVTYLDGVNDKAVLLGQLLDCDDSVLALALSHDQLHLAAAGCDRLIRVWNIPDIPSTARLEQTIDNHADWILGLAFSPDGKYLLSASRDNTARIWDLTAKTTVATFLGHQNVVHAVALSQDGTQAMSVGEDGGLRFWYAKDQETKSEKEVKAKDIKAAGKQIKVAKGGHSKAVFQLVVGGDAERALAATSSADGTVKLWNLATGAPTGTLTGLSDYIYALAISPDGSMVAAGSWNGEVRIWDESSAKVVAAFTAAPK
jgi:WD40 repeat protein